MSQIQVLPLDDERIVVEGLSAIFEREADFVVLGRPTCAAEALDLCANSQPDLVLVSLSLRGIDVAAFARAVRSRAPRARLLVLAARADDLAIRAATEARADGCLSRAVSAADLVQSARLIAHGQAIYPAFARPHLVAEAKSPRVCDNLRLTGREREVLRFVALGATSREIADRLVLSAKTVDNHRSRILEKLQVRNKAEAVALALRHGLLEPDLVDDQSRRLAPCGADETTGVSSEATGEVTPIGPALARHERASRSEHPDTISSQREARPVSGAA